MQGLRGVLLTAVQAARGGQGTGDRTKPRGLFWVPGWLCP